MIACVLKSGGDFLPAEEFICLTDLDLDCQTLALDHDWPGWWSKIELFRLPSAL